MDKNLLFLGGASVALIAALLTIIDRILSLRERFRSSKTETPALSLQEDSPPVPDFSPDLQTPPPGRVTSPLAYLFYREILIIGGAGILLNYIGLALSLQLENILFLDMTGTALAAFLLGPWWGAVVALLSSSVVNWLLYPEPGADFLIFPWSLVNMTGALFWGMVARTSRFERYLSGGHNSVMPHFLYLITLGVLGAVVMSIPGVLIQAALAQHTELALHSTVVQTLKDLIAEWQTGIQGHLESILGVAQADRLGWGLVLWVQTCIQYIPDKTLSVAIALVVLKYGFPLFERELVHGGPTGRRPQDTSITPLILGLLYAPSFVALVSSDMFSGARYWPLWSTPWFIMMGGVLVLLVRRTSSAETRVARFSRAERYVKALKPIEEEPSYQFCRRLTLATLIASTLVALCLPLLLPDYGSVAFHFFCLVYGFLLAMHLLHVSISQNLHMAREGGFSLGEKADRPDSARRSRAK